MADLAAKFGIGVNAWVWTSPFNRQAVPLIAKAANMGFDTFTMPIEDPDLIDIEATRAALSEHPLRLHVSGAFGAERDLTHEDTGPRENCLNYIRRVLVICEQLGATLLAGPAYSATGKRRKLCEDMRRREWDLAVQGLRQASKMASDYGVTLAIEPLNRFETDLVNTASQAKRLIQAVDSPSVRIHLDTFHMHIEEQCVYSAIMHAGADLVYLDASESDRGTPGKGQVHWQEVVRGLRDSGYSGDCVIESFTPECEAVAEAAAIWRPLAPSQDALASDGCRFLKALFSDGGDSQLVTC